MRSNVRPKARPIMGVRAGDTPQIKLEETCIQRKHVARPAP